MSAGLAPAAGWDPGLCPWVAVQPRHKAQHKAQHSSADVLFHPCSSQLIPAPLTPGTALMGPSWAHGRSGGAAGEARSLSRR